MCKLYGNGKPKNFGFLQIYHKFLKSDNGNPCGGSDFKPSRE